MTGPLTGLKGFSRSDAFATAAQRNGDVADPRHGVAGEHATPYPWEQFPGESHGPYGLENGLLGVDVFPSYTSEAGQLGEDPTADLTPLTRAAPWPKGVPTTTDPEDVANWRTQSAEIHATNMGGGREALYEPTLNPQQDTWIELNETDPGILFPELEKVPNQQKTGGTSGWGSRDVVQSNARQNEYGFNAAHMHRRYAAGSIPGNYMWMEPGNRPLIRTYAGTANVPVGPDSPFYGQDPGAAFDAQGAVLQNLPSAYSPPPSPALADSPGTYSDVAGVDLW